MRFIDSLTILLGTLHIVCALWEDDSDYSLLGRDAYNDQDYLLYLRDDEDEDANVKNKREVKMVKDIQDFMQKNHSKLSEAIDKKKRENPVKKDDPINRFTSESSIRCQVLVSKFKKGGPLDLLLDNTKRHLEWDLWQYMEYDHLTYEAQQIKALASQCNVAGIKQMGTVQEKFTTPFWELVKSLVAGAKKNGGADKEVAKLACKVIGGTGC